MNYSPITSSYRTQLVPGSNVAAYDLNQQQRDPIVIDKFQFSCLRNSPGNPDPAAAAAVAQIEVGTFVDFALQVGSREVRMGDLVPLPSFCARKGYADGAALNSGIEVGNGTYYQWSLPKPMLVLPGTRIYALLRYPVELQTGGFRPLAIDVTVTMIGRSLRRGETPPLTTCVPFLTGWRAPAVAIGAGVQVAQSSPDPAIANQFDIPVRVTSMLGCLATQFWAGEVIPDAMVRISSSMGGYIVRELTPLMELFSGRHRAWNIACSMQPKEYWTVELEYSTNALLTPITDYVATDEVQGIFGLQGYREVPLETLYRDPLATDWQPRVETARAAVDRGVRARE